MKQTPPHGTNNIGTSAFLTTSELIRLETRTTKGTASLIDHILTNTDELVLQSGVVDVGLTI